MASLIDHPPGKALLPFERGIIIGRHETGQNPAQIARETGVRDQTVRDTLRKAQQRDEQKSSHAGAPRKTDAITDRHLIRSTKADHHQPLRELNLNIAPGISVRTVHRRLH